MINKKKALLIVGAWVVVTISTIHMLFGLIGGIVAGFFSTVFVIVYLSNIITILLALHTLRNIEKG